MKILLVSPLPPPANGIGSWTSNILEYYSGNSDGFKIIHQNTAYKYRDILKYDLWNRFYLGIRETTGMLIELRNNIKKISPDLIHFTSSASLGLLRDYIVIKIARRKNVALVFHWHFGRIPALARNKNWEWWLLIRIIRRCHMNVVIDNESFNTLLQAGFVNVVNIPNPVGLKLEMKILASEVNSRRKAGTLIFVAHIIKKKGVFELVEACAQLNEVNELLLVGSYEPAVKAELLKLAGIRDSGNWLKFRGTLDIDRVLDEMKYVPILALPSYTEGFPNAVIEAMSMGCAVIATGVGAIPQILAVSTDKPCGICVPVRNIELLKDAILLMIKNPESTNRMGMTGRERILENFTLKKVTVQYESAWMQASDRLNHIRKH